MKRFISIVILGLVAVACMPIANDDKTIVNFEEKYPAIVSYELNLQSQALQFYTTDENGAFFGNHGTFKTWVTAKGKTLKFAMNGGMYRKDLRPQGLYIENGVLEVPIDTKEKGYGNFYLKPNGVFSLSKTNKPAIELTEAFHNNGDIAYATQSGPMLLIAGNIHPAFRAGSTNVHIRNGVGILPNGHLLFAISQEKINFYTLASFFKDHDCKEALYLDGFVSRMYLPTKNWLQEDGNFGIIIAEVE